MHTESHLLTNHSPDAIRNNAVPGMGGHNDLFKMRTEGMRNIVTMIGFIIKKNNVNASKIAPYS